jgi:hypothetical protein
MTTSNFSTATTGWIAIATGISVVCLLVRSESSPGKGQAAR